MTGGDARFNVPTGIAVNAAGTLYVTDSQNYTIRAITPGGFVTTFAGDPGEFGSTNGVGNAASFGAPQGAAVDSAGNVYIADTFNHAIRMITPGGVVTTLAGGSFGNTDGTGSAARFNSPRGVAVDSAGTVYVADTNNHTIRMITPGGVVTTLAGLASSPGNADGTGSVARFNQPRGIAVDGAGVLYVADTNNHAIRKITAGGVVTTFAGLAGTSGNTDGTGNAARFNSPRGVAVDSAGTLYVADTNNNNIRQVTAAAVVTRLAGSTTPGGVDGTGNAARFNAPEGVAVDSAGVVYVADTVNDTIRKITAGGVVTTLAGFYGSLGAVDGTGPTARFAYPFGVAIDTSGTIYVADRTNSTIRKVTPTGNVTTFAGLANSPGSIDGTGSAARFSVPVGIAVDSAGTVYVADAVNTIRTITPAGVATTLAGLALTSGSADGTGSAARFSGLRGIAVDNTTGNVYVADGNNHTIRKIAPGGVVTTFAGLAGNSGSTDGTGSAARFNSPRGVAVNAAGTVYVADMNNNTIRQITPLGVVTTLAGMAPQFGSSDGTGSAARFGGPQAIAVDDTGTLYVADTSNHTIRKVTPGGVVTTIAGCSGCPGAENWDRFNTPSGIAVNAKGDVYVADTRNNTIRTSAPLLSSLVVDFGPSYGIWMRRETTWTQLHPLSAEGILRIDDGSSDALVIDFGPGVGLWVWIKEQDEDAFWFQLNAGSPSAMMGVDFDGDGEVETGVFDFPGQGLWMYDGENNQWFQMHPFNTSQLAAADLNGDGREEAIIDFPGYGVWSLDGDGTWSQVHPSDVSAILAVDVDSNGSKDLVMTFPGYGVWSYRISAGWSQLNPRDATRLAAADLDGNGVADLVIDFGASVGVWVLQNGTTWWQMNPLTSEGITTGDLDGNGHDEVIFDFGGVGVWSYEDLAGWQQVHTFNPRTIVTGSFP